MSKGTRQKIMDMAKTLFNERGFNVVSIRDISNELGISKGNLTYYFKKKEDIIEAILEDAADSQQFPQAPRTLAEMDALFLHIQEVVQNNGFYFWHHTQLSQLSDKIQQQQNAVYQRNAAVFKQAFFNLRNAGLLREALFPPEYDRVIDTLLLTSIYWLQFCGLRQEAPQKSEFQKQMWTILYPFLTDRGKSLLQNIVKLA